MCRRKFWWESHWCFNGVCTPYFSVADLTVASATQGDTTKDVFCTSGVSYYLTIATVASQYCNSYTLTTPASITTPCDNTKPNTCIYSDKATPTPNVLPDDPSKCQCGFNTAGSPYCALGSGSDAALALIAQNKANRGGSLCHSSERTNAKCIGNIVNDIINPPTPPTYNQNTAANNAALLARKIQTATNFAIYQNPDTCTSSFIAAIQPVKLQPTKCAKWICSAAVVNTTQCFNSTQSYTDDQIVVWYQSCTNTTQVCPGAPNSVYSLTETTTATCKDPGTNPTPTSLNRLPGEPCKVDGDCKAVSGGGKCSSTCSGKAVGDTCASDEECTVGNACASGKCTKQSAAGGACLRSEECQNNLICQAKKTCIAMYSLAVAAAINPADFVGKDVNVACAFGSYDSVKNVCTQPDYKDNTQIDKNGFVNCTYQSPCSYDDGSQQECGCGYNLDGQGYCPLSKKQGGAAWTSYYTARAKLFNNKCHTLHRNYEQCYVYGDGTVAIQKNSDVKALLALRAKTEVAHIYNFAAPCAPAYNSASSSFLQTSLVLIFAVLAFIF